MYLYLLTINTEVSRKALLIELVIWVTMLMIDGHHSLHFVLTIYMGQVLISCEHIENTNSLF